MIRILFIIVLFFHAFVYSDEIIRDDNGNYFLMKKDGTFQKLPAPKPGHKYVIKKRTIEKKILNDKFEVPKKKARTRTNQGFR